MHIYIQKDRRLTCYSFSVSQVSGDDRCLHMKRGLLVQRLEQADSGLYTCTSHEHSYIRVLARYRLQIIPNHSLHFPRHLHNDRPDHPAPMGLGRTGPAEVGVSGFLSQAGAPHLPPLLQGHRNLWLPSQLPLRTYKDLHMAGTNSLSVDAYCEQLWYREKRRQQKLRTMKLKQKQERRKARVRRNNPPEIHLRSPGEDWGRNKELIFSTGVVIVVQLQRLRRIMTSRSCLIQFRNKLHRKWFTRSNFTRHQSMLKLGTVWLLVR